MSNKLKSRDSSLDILKGIGIFTMVLAHCNMGELFNEYVAGFHMQLFFWVSGVLFNQSKYSFRHFVKRKAKTLLIPYLTFAVITIMYCGIISLINNNNIYNFPDCLIGVIYSNRSIFPITGALWFLQCLFFVSIIFYMIGIFGEKVRAIFIVIFFIVARIQSIYEVWLPFALDSALSAIIIFYFGYLSKKIVFREYQIKKTLFISACIIVISLISIFINKDVNPRTCSYGQYYILYYLNALAATFGYFLFSKCFIKPVYFKNLLSTLGKDSIIYVGLNQLTITSLYHFLVLIYSFNYSIEKALRNIVIFIVTMILLKVITDYIGKSKYKILIGK